MDSAAYIDPEDLEINRLLAEGHLHNDDLRQAKLRQTNESRSLLSLLNQTGVLSDDHLLECYRSISGLPDIDPFALDNVPEDCLELINPQFLKRSRALLLSEDGPLAVVDPLDDTALRAAEFALGAVPDQVLIKAGDWARAYAALYEQSRDLSLDINDPSAVFIDDLVADQDRDAPIVRRVATWFAEAADLGASDIHFDAKRNALEVRYRIDGVLRTVASESKSAADSVIARIKVLSGLDLGERQAAQDGRATIVVRGRRLDIRVSIIPTIDGESAVIRLLDRPSGLLSIEGLGFSEEITSALQSMMARRNGLFVVAGPTGSGKTTTLYACLEHFKNSGLKILSVEDPVEYHFDHVSQVQVSGKDGTGFAGAIRAFLRHDPDIILVGEIRDGETAQVAVEAALQGHLVLATLHATDVARVRTRLIDMGVEPFKLDATLNGALAQRLVRLLCPECAQANEITPEEEVIFSKAGVDAPSDLYVPNGCPSCGQTGFSKRHVLGEITLSAQVIQPDVTMEQDGLRLVALGKTALSEVVGLDVG
ncbi:MAG: GspE/PulE family protein [Pseudomonadota bacterium]